MGWYAGIRNMTYIWNEHGVCVNSDKAAEFVFRRCFATVLIAQRPDKAFVFAAQHRGPTTGGGRNPWLTTEACSRHKDALTVGLKELRGACQENASSPNSCMGKTEHAEWRHIVRDIDERLAEIQEAQLELFV